VQKLVVTHESVSKNPQHLLLGVADRELRVIENFYKRSKTGEGKL